MRQLASHLQHDLDYHAVDITNTRGCCLPTSCQHFVDTSLIVSNANLAWLLFSQGPCNARILQQVLWGTVFSMFLLFF